jgi:large subunit ribosomal protein L25
MLQFDLSAQERNLFGKGASKKMRRDGKTPAIMYGASKETLALKFDTKELMRVLLKLQRRNAVFNIDVEGEGGSARRHVMVKEVQTDPIKDTLVHADFCEVSLDQPITLQVPVKYIGTPKGVELGGELSVNLATVTLRGLILDIPDYFELDVSHLLMGKKVTCADLQVAGNIELLNDKDEVCASIHAARLVSGEEDERGAAQEAEGPSEGSEEVAAG